MIQGQKVLAFIPARAGSKGLPDKNIRLFRGKPLMAWSIQAALGSGYIDEVLVSTDSEAYADIARQFGASVPFLRPAELANDAAGMADTIRDCLNQLAALGQHFDWIICLQPTSPLRTAQHIRQALEQFMAIPGEDKTMVSVSRLPAKYGWVLQQSAGERIAFMDPALRQQQNFSRQHNTAVYLPNGAIFIASARNFDGFYTNNAYPYEMAAELSVDIDTLEEFSQAETLAAGADIASCSQ